ncbi:zf-HC2 domain-containing protein [Streptomyces zhihengii]
MSSQQPHRDVAAYALGVLEPGDALRFEEHLGGCGRCAVQLSDFSGRPARSRRSRGRAEAWRRPPRACWNG